MLRGEWRDSGMEQGMENADSEGFASREQLEGLRGGRGRIYLRRSRCTTGTEVRMKAQI